MSATTLPPCGLYRTTSAIGDVPAGRLVYFHNHGDPGPGVYLPTKWTLNRADFESKGYTLPEPFDRFAATLEALPEDGFYRVTKEFYCCEKRCRRFDPELLVQLGYNASGEAILFIPELTGAGIALPETGSAIIRENLKNLAALTVVEPSEEDEEASATPAPSGTTLH
jgi:hypothetical protein